ncbi:thioredoxin-like isoform X2 [Mytilus californianus]|uniref:thioredoxin-like isoform X2 n=1 Tax=Mytilus californianus TaxID=6549 RepID=UPI00224766AC|nr:thioredoxin-like isoform X2 [Mytilus californianus]
MVKNVKSQSEFHVAVKEYGYTLLVVDFFATWCGPCVTSAPIYEKLSYEYSDCIFLKLDVDEVEDVSSECGITAMPTFQCYRGGQKIDELVGANEDKLREMIEKNM